MVKAKRMKKVINIKTTKGHHNPSARVEDHNEENSKITEEQDEQSEQSY